MNPCERAIRYFALNCGHKEFWSWAPEATGVVWDDGSVVASREELVSILRHLQATGLPPFGAIVHLVAAYRGKRITITWKEVPEEKPPSLRVHCIIESGGKQVYQFQRVRSFGTPESISAGAARLAELPSELGGILNDPRALPELAVLLFTELGQPELSEGIITLLGDGKLKEEELNQPPWHAKYPSVLQDLALLTKSLEKLPPGKLRSTLMVTLAAQPSPVGGQQSEFLPGPRQADDSLRVVRQFELPLRREWQQAASSSWGFCAASLAPTGTDPGLIVIRCAWEGTAQIARWRTAHPGKPVLLVPVGDERVLVHQPGCPMLPDQFLPQLEGAFTKPVVVGCGGWLPAGTLQLAWNGKYIWALATKPAESILTWRRRGEFGYFNFDTHPPDPVASGCGPRSWNEFQPVVYETSHHPERIELTGHGPDGQCWTGSSDPEFQDLLGHPEDLAGMVPTRTGVAVGIGRHLEIFDWTSVLASYSFDRPIRRLHAGRHGSRTAIVIGFERGVQLHWLGSDDVLRVDDQVVNPVASLTADGRLVVVGDHWGRVYELDWRGVRAVHPFEWSAPAPVAVIPTPSPSEFATLSQDGSAQIWSIA